MSADIESATVSVERGGRIFGPYSADKVLALYRERRLLETDLATTSDNSQLRPLGLVMRQLDKPLPDYSVDDGTSLKYVVPIGRNGWAIAAGYLGLLSPLVIFAPPAVICGIVALVQLKKRPGQLGRVRAWLGVILGGIVTSIVIVTLTNSLFSD